MDKKQLSERDICTKFITPALRQAGWDELTQLREEVTFTKGRVIVRVLRDGSVWRELSSAEKYRDAFVFLLTRFQASTAFYSPTRCQVGLLSL